MVDGTIKRKHNQNLNPAALIDALVDSEDSARVVALFVNTTWDSTAKATNNITFMDSRELRRFILATNPMSEGFLQRWVPYWEHHKHGFKPVDTTLHCTWTPHKSLVQQRVNLMGRSGALGEGKGANIDRSRAINIDETKTAVQTLSPSHKLHVRVASICELIAAHIYKVTGDRLRVHGLTGYFKLSSNNKLYFLWARFVEIGLLFVNLLGHDLNAP